ncbi:LysR family transcriptional regulator [Marinobacterium lutimaris]|uniref:DNA-binding transcriptional regulator, LysR family n=1 Tax=Marinobacterium lutimaris TaxID=568106 RepID=A0A1H6DT80_9GAMM|nr:LysR family transcriptional regulator [Marinobacterium lutimaris]SEG88224.1 DNA-binding transcriptional regulator, LysR family [Marinobacterium lutimaris]
MKKLEKLDINMFRTLVTIYERGSFTEAAHLIGINQSTASYTMKILRDSFEDPLFVRTGNKIEPTDRCHEIVEEVRDILTTLDRLASKKDFEPKEAQGRVVISCNYHERRALIPEAVRRIRREAPHIKIDLHEAAVDGKRQLLENTVDILLGPVAIIGDVFYRRNLFTDQYICLMDVDNYLADQPLSLEQFCNAKHIAVTHNGHWEALFYSVLRLQGINLAPDLSIPSHDNLGQMIRGSDLVATIPGRLANVLGDGLVTKPFPLEVPIAIDMYWTERTHFSGLHKWIRQILAEVSAEHRQRPPLGVVVKNSE